MKRSRHTNAGRPIAGLLICLLVGFLVRSLTAQAASNSTLSYDPTQEVTVHGAVLDVLTEPSQGMIMGTHLLLAIDQGTLDVSLGRFALQGKSALSVKVGEEIVVTGVMKTLREKRVFLARSVTARGQVYTIRTAHGIPVSPKARERALQDGKSL